MSSKVDELLAVAQRLGQLAEESQRHEVSEPLNRLEEAADEIGKAWSGSWIGYHSRVYYEDFNTPPEGAHFSSEWGFIRRLNRSDTTGAWHERDFDEVVTIVRERAEQPDLEAATDLAGRCKERLRGDRETIISITETELGPTGDQYLERLRDKATEDKHHVASHFIGAMRPAEQTSRDSVAASHGLQAPPHLYLLAEVQALRSGPLECARLESIARCAAAHIEREERAKITSQQVGTDVFIGHGHSPLWRELKDFVQDRLGLSYEEFNRVPAAGIANSQRLSEMLDAAAIAFLVLTAEDQGAGGTRQARMNVIHEAGLFQGRLGFNKAIILLEEGCEEFTNIQGLVHIPFPTGNIAAAFEDVRLVLEREGLVQPGA